MFYKIPGGSITINNFFLALLLAIAVAFISYRFRYLTFCGSVTQFFIALAIFSSGGLKWSIPILTFFFTSSYFTKINYRKSYDRSGNQNIARNNYQVLANGGIPGLLAVVNIFYNEEFIFFCYLSTICVVCSDTWSTEIGTLIKSNTYNILNLKKVEPGFSGGVSITGTVGGILGSLVIGISGFVCVDFNLNVFVIIIVSGILGNLLDSLLGSVAQLKNICPKCHKIIENDFHCGVKSDFYSGLRWITNDTVNLLASISGILFFTTLHKIL